MSSIFNSYKLTLFSLLMNISILRKALKSFYFNGKGSILLTVIGTVLLG
ncbi:hypothetical protein YN1HA_18910 [Sulfurisphaera ohwakuensis]